MSVSSQAIRRVAKEIKDLTLKPLEGIKIVPNDKDITEIQAVIDGPVDTPFEGGAFKVKLKLGADFPQAPPKGNFVTKIFHPNVAPSTGEICVNTLKRDWNESYGISHILLTVKCLLMVPNAESSLNEEAGRLLLEAYDDYFSRAKTWTSIHALKKEEKREENKDEKEEEQKDSEKSETKDNDGGEENTLTELNSNSVPYHFDHDRKIQSHGFLKDAKLKNSSTKTVVSVVAAKPKVAAAAPKRGVKRL